MENKIERLMDIAPNNLDQKLKEIGKLYAIVLKKYKESLYALNKKEIELSNAWAERYSYYKCDYDFQLSNAEIKNFIDNDIETSQLRLEIKNLKTDCEVLEKHLKNIESLRWDIKTLIEYMKLDRIV